MNEPTASAPSAMNFQVIAPSRYGIGGFILSSLSTLQIILVSFSSRHHCTALLLYHCLLKKKDLSSKAIKIICAIRQDLTL